MCWRRDACLHGARAAAWPPFADQIAAGGFLLGGLLFGPIWLLVQGAWPFALAGGVALAFLPGPIWPGVFILSGLCGQDMRRATLSWRGWHMKGVVVGGSSEQAELRWFDRHLGRPGVG